MCPACMTSVALAVAGTTSGAGLIGYIAVRIKRLRRRDRTSIAACAAPDGESR
jgi:hypothetical protein